MVLGTVVYVAKILLLKLQSSELREALLMFGYKSELDELQRRIKAISDFLRDAEREREVSFQIQTCIEAVLEADDLFDEVITLVKQKKLLTGDGNLSKKVSNIFTSSVNPFSSAHGMSKRIKNMKKKLDGIVYTNMFSLNPDPEPSQENSPRTCSYVNEVEIIGREHDLEAIVDTLLHPNDQTDVSVLSIVGMAGVGKTALAQLVYNDPRVTHAFQLKLWTCCYQDHYYDLDVEHILCMILASISHEIPDQASTMDQLQNQLQQHLAGKKYLLVLDDVCGTGHQLSKLVNYLSGGARGSWIVVTGEFRDIDTVGRLSHELMNLSEENSWHLFEKMAFESDQPNPPDELVKIGQVIVDRCVGVPLAIRVAGRLLYGQGKSKWLSVQQDVSAEDYAYLRYPTLPILKLNFDHLESPLKSCLCYCALFPRNYVIDKGMLINLWMAQGYIVPLREGQSLEDAAQEYFTILLHRCFFQDAGQDAYGEIISCKIHKVFYELACDVARMEMCLNEWHRLDKNTLHLNLMGTTVASRDIHSTQIRSLLHVGGWYKGIEMDQSRLKELINDCKCLRTLDLSNLGIKSLPNSVGKLVHLRYLNLKQNRDLKVLPKEIKYLFSLQTLILRECHGLTKLPGLSKLTNLRVLDIKDCSGLTCMPSGLGKLTSVHTLTEFVLGETSFKLNQWFDQLEGLKPLQNLRGHLAFRIQFLNSAIYAREFAGWERRYLENKAYLNHIRFSFNGEDVDGSSHEQLMRVLQPHANMKGLDLCGYDSARMPAWISFLPNLVRLCLENCRKLRYLPYSRNLVHLKVFHLVNMFNLEYIFEYGTASASGSNPAVSASTGSQSAEVPSLFPSLEELHLINLPNLKGWFGPEAGLGVEDDHMFVSIGSKVHLQSLFHWQLKSLIVERCPEPKSVPPGSRVEGLSTCGAGTSSTKESIDPATEKTYDLKVIEETEADSSLPLSLNVHPPLNSALPPAMVADDAAYTLPLSSDLLSPRQCAPPFDDMVVDDALLYCALFPPDYEFERSALLQLWVADGIFDEEPMEEIAGLFFEYCLAKGYFEVSRFIFQTREAMFTFKGDNYLFPKCSRVKRIEGTFNSHDLSPEVSHVSVSCHSLNDAHDLCQFERFKRLRTLIFLQGHLLSFKQLPRDFFLSVKMLRALDLSYTCLVELPSSLGNMKCLRYLDLTKTPIKHMPEALDCLENLQTLKLRGCSSISTLPKGMRRLAKLRHLDFDVLRQLRSMPEGMGDLTNIRTLSAFIVDVAEGRSIRQLKNMNNLSGSFCISGLQNVWTGNEAMEANLCYKSHLRKLEFRWSDSQRVHKKDKEVVCHKEVLSSLQPNASLEELRISCYGGSELPCWICHTSFYRLVHITLFKCEHCEVLPSVGQLPALKSLNIVDFDKLEVIDHNFYGGNDIQGHIAFPKLEKLTIQNMLSLGNWRDTSNSHFPQLSSLTIKKCPKLFSLCKLASLRSLKELEIAHCGMLASCLDEEVPPSLETFIIEECPLITARILEEEDLDWLKLLVQIPNVWIDHQELSGLNSSEGEEDESD